MPEENRNSESFLTRFYRSADVDYNQGRYIYGLGLFRQAIKKIASHMRQGGPVIDSSVSVPGDSSQSSKTGEKIHAPRQYEQNADRVMECEGRAGSEYRHGVGLRRTFSLVMILIVFPVLIGVCMYLFSTRGYSQRGILQEIFGSRIYYATSLVMIFFAIAAFLISFEGRRPKSGEIALLAALSALACAGRAIFYMLPSVKPVTAVVIVTGAAFGGEAGFLTGALSMLVSNFLFGQGPWTPWQMYAMGIIGFISGLVYGRRGRRKIMHGRVSLSLFGFVMAFVIYGGIMNPAALIMSVGQVTVPGLLSYYAAGIPVDLVHAVSTFIFLWIGGPPLMEKLERVQVKYGLYRCEKRSENTADMEK